VDVPPVVELSTIRLRRPRITDAEAIFEYGSDPEVARYADWPRQTSVEPILESLKERENLWKRGDEYHWIVTLLKFDRAIGGISCMLNNSSAEIGYLLNRRYWGNGYATEGALAVTEWLLSQSSIFRVWATCDTENAASIRVLEKIGMQREGLLRSYSIRPGISEFPRDAYIYARIKGPNA
jgi:RimJ/RimL family protein N-acetyltransferase